MFPGDIANIAISVGVLLYGLDMALTKLRHNRVTPIVDALNIRERQINALMDENKLYRDKIATLEKEHIDCMHRNDLLTKDVESLRSLFKIIEKRKIK